MELLNLFEEIESTKFQSKFMIYSGFKLVRNALSRDPMLVSLTNDVRLNPSRAYAIAERIPFLYAHHEEDAGSAFDISVAAYLLCLYRTNQAFAKELSKFVLEMGKLWWSVDLALQISRNMELFAHPGKRYFRYFGEATPIEYTTWSTRVKPIRTKEVFPFKVNGEQRWNISGQLSVRSLQKTRTLVH